MARSMVSVARVAFLILMCGCVAFAQDAGRKDANVTRATLDNGMRVVIIRDALAPVVTVMQNYLVGGDETPAGISGDGSRAGAYGISGMPGCERRSDCSDLCGVGRVEQRRHAAERYAILHDHTGGGRGIGTAH